MNWFGQLPVLLLIFISLYYDPFYVKVVEFTHRLQCIIIFLCFCDLDRFTDSVLVREGRPTKYCPCGSEDRYVSTVFVGKKQYPMLMRKVQQQFPIRHIRPLDVAFCIYIFKYKDIIKYSNSHIYHYVSDDI